MSCVGDSAMAEKMSTRKTSVDASVELTGACIEIGALLAGAESLIGEVYERSMHHNQENELDTLYALRLLQQAIGRIDPLAEGIEKAILSAGAKKANRPRAAAQATTGGVDHGSSEP